jgi:predicted RNA binding protein YcfA (HicA-like mRNA interferase family)
MKLPRNLSGNDLAELLCRHWNYRIVHQQGSHVILETETPSHQRLAVPAHKNLRVGTLNAILRAVARHKGVERQDLLKSL